MEQARAELGQAQVKLEVVLVGVKVEVEIVDEIGVQLLARRVGGWWVGAELEKHKYPSILDTEEHFHIEEH